MLAASVGATAAFAVSAQAQNLLVNGDFENAGGFTANPITPSGVNGGWAPYNANAAQSNMGSSPDSPESGSFALIETQAAGGSWTVPGAYQIVQPVGGIQAGATYTMTGFYLTDANPAGTVDAGIQLGFRGAWNGTAFPTLGTDASLPGYWVNIPTANDDTWIPFSVSEVAPAGATGIISYVQMGYGKDTVAQGGTDLYYDNVSVTEVVPEPASLAIVGMGLASSFFLIRRRKS